MRVIGTLFAVGLCTLTLQVSGSNRRRLPNQTNLAWGDSLTFGGQGSGTPVRRKAAASNTSRPEGTTPRGPGVQTEPGLFSGLKLVSDAKAAPKPVVTQPNKSTGSNFFSSLGNLAMRAAKQGCRQKVAPTIPRAQVTRKRPAKSAVPASRTGSSKPPASKTAARMKLQQRAHELTAKYKRGDLVWYKNQVWSVTNIDATTLHTSMDLQSGGNTDFVMGSQFNGVQTAAEVKSDYISKHKNKLFVAKFPDRVNNRYGHHYTPDDVKLDLKENVVMIYMRRTDSPSIRVWFNRADMDEKFVIQTIPK